MVVKEFVQNSMAEGNVIALVSLDYKELLMQPDGLRS
jgi:hypothetical protein